MSLAVRNRGRLGGGYGAQYGPYWRGYLTQRLAEEAASRAGQYVGQKARNVVSRYVQRVRDRIRDVGNLARPNWKKRKTQPPGTPDRSMRPSKVNKKYNTRGYTGQMRRFKRVKSESYYAKHGSEKRIEYGNTQTSQACIYVGHHTTPIREVVETFARACIRMLAKRAGLDFPSWQTRHGFLNQATAIQFYWTQINADSAAATEVAYYFTFETSWGQEAVTLAEKFWALTEGDSPIMITEMNITRSNGGQVFPLARINMRQCKLHISATSTMSLQNRTLASTTTDITNSDNVANNPLVGREYKTTGSGFWPDADRNQAMSYALWTDPRYGLIRQPGVIGTSTTANENLDINTLARPPHANFFKATSSRAIKLNPGEIKKTVVSYRRAITPAELFVMMYDQMKLATTPPASTDRKLFHTFGKTTMIALEKLLDDRATDEPTLSIGFENNLYIRSYLSYRNSNPACILEVPKDV